MDLNQDIILRYVAGKATEDEVLLVDQAMTGDRLFFVHLRSLLYLRDHFDEVWNSVSSDAVGLGSGDAAAGAARTAAADGSPVIPGRSREVSRQTGSKVLGSFRLLMDQTRKLACVAAESLAPGLSSRLQLGFSGIGSPDRTLGLHLERGMELLARGEIATARSELVVVGTLDAREAQNACLKAERAGKTVLEVHANAVRGTVEVKFWPAPGQAVPTAAILVPDVDPERAVSAPLEPAEGEDAWLAEFICAPNGSSRLSFLGQNPNVSA